jgi:hypothetical protein
MKSPFLRNLVIGCVLVGFFLGCATAPSQRVSYRRHPNLAEAQMSIERAENKISAAQEANEFDMDGHAAKAKELLSRAHTEIKLAAEAANAHR